MAFQDNQDGQMSTTFGIVYNVTMAVGLNCPNAEDDVMLVQYLIKKIHELKIDYPKPQKPFKVDGICGPMTRQEILKFQLEMAKRGHSILADGRVDRARGRVSKISNTQYTILHLNAAVKSLIGEERFAKLWEEPDMPPELVTPLSVSVPPLFL